MCVYVAVCVYMYNVHVHTCVCMVGDLETLNGLKHCCHQKKAAKYISLSLENLFLDTHNDWL